MHLGLYLWSFAFVAQLEMGFGWTSAIMLGIIRGLGFSRSG